MVDSEPVERALDVNAFAEVGRLFKFSLLQQCAHYCNNRYYK